MRKNEYTELTDLDRAANDAAEFHHGAVQDDGETYAQPRVETAGVQVYVYWRDGILVVSLDFEGADTGEDSPARVYGGGHGPGSERIPVVVYAGPGDPVWAELPRDAVTATDARCLRAAGEARETAWVIPDWVYEGG